MAYFPLNATISSVSALQITAEYTKSLVEGGRICASETFYLFTISSLVFTWDPITWDPVTWDPVTWDPVTWNPVTWDPVTWEPVTWDPVTWYPVTWDPVTWDPVTWDSVTCYPVDSFLKYL